VIHNRRDFLKRALQTVAAATGLALVQANKLLGQEKPTFTTTDTIYQLSREPYPYPPDGIAYLNHFDGIKLVQIHLDGLITRDIA